MTDSARASLVTPSDVWPSLPLDEWRETHDTLHMWTQIVGKIRTKLTPPINHWWHVPLYVSTHGLITSPIPYGHRLFEMEFDFIDHLLLIRTSEGAARTVPLAPRSVADFYAEVMARLRELDLEISIWTTPVEVFDPIPFEQDTTHASYDAAYARRFWQALVQADRVLKQFRSPFIGKSSPVHFFWGSFDLAVTRFSGRRAPPHPGVAIMADFITREAYSHEVSSAGWWPGSGPIGKPAFYAYAYPTPDGFKDAPLRPDEAFYSDEMGEFILLYDDVRRASDPDRMLLEFLQSTYEATATLANWDRSALEQAP
jgi:hypothetical protein